MADDQTTVPMDVATAIVVGSEAEAAALGNANKRQRRSIKDKTFIEAETLRRKEFDKQLQILKDRGAALALSTGSEIVLGVVTKEGEPVLWSTPGLEDYMLRDCDFNESAPCAVTVSRMVHGRRQVMASSVSELPLEEKQKALKVLFLQLFEMSMPSEADSPKVIHEAHSWYPSSVPFKQAPEHYTLQDRDSNTGELYVDMLLKAALTVADQRRFEEEIQRVEHELPPAALASLLVCIKKYITMTVQKTKSGAKSKALSKSKAYGRLIDNGLATGPTRPPPNLTQCGLVFQEGRPFLGARATTQQIQECLQKEPSIKYNKGGTVKVGGNPVNLHELYNEVREHGGQRMVTDTKAWKKVAAALSLSPCNAEMCRSLRNTYQRYLGPISGVSPERERGAGESSMGLQEFKP
jgi:hypothetical protein